MIAAESPEAQQLIFLAVKKRPTDPEASGLFIA